MKEMPILWVIEQLQKMKSEIDFLYPDEQAAYSIALENAICLILDNTIALENAICLILDKTIKNIKKED